MKLRNINITLNPQSIIFGLIFAIIFHLIGNIINNNKIQAQPKPASELREIYPEYALKHPNWGSPAGFAYKIEGQIYVIPVHIYVHH
jgi:hypothetical protein